MVLNAFPDYRQTIRNWISENDKAVTRWTIQGMQQGEYIGIPPLASKSKRQGLISSVPLMASRKKRRTAQIYTLLPWPPCEITASLLYSYPRPSNLQSSFGLHQTGERRVITVYLLGGSIAALILVVIVVLKVWSVQRRKALKQILERYHESEQALVRYVMLNRQCSEEVAYQRLATFVKKHVPLDDHNHIDRTLAHDRQSLLDSASSILVHDPDEIDKI
jgi:SnoaL-like polyketide cyclase